MKKFCIAILIFVVVLGISNCFAMTTDEVEYYLNYTLNNMSVSNPAYNTFYNYMDNTDFSSFLEYIENDGYLDDMNYLNIKLFTDKIQLVFFNIDFSSYYIKFLYAGNGHFLQTYSISSNSSKNQPGHIYYNFYNSSYGKYSDNTNLNNQGSDLKLTSMYPTFDVYKDNNSTLASSQEIIDFMNSGTYPNEFLTSEYDPFVSPYFSDIPNQTYPFRFYNDMIGSFSYGDSEDRDYIFKIQKWSLEDVFISEKTITNIIEITDRVRTLHLDYNMMECTTDAYYMLIALNQDGEIVAQSNAFTYTKSNDSIVIPSSGTITHNVTPIVDPDTGEVTGYEVEETDLTREQQTETIIDGINNITDRIEDKLEDTKNSIISGIINGFENVIKSIIEWLFAPSEDQINDLINQVNNTDIISESVLGFPLELMKKFVNLFRTANYSDFIIQWDDIYFTFDEQETLIFSAYSFNVSELIRDNETFSYYYSIYLIFVDFFCACGFVWWCIGFFKDILGVSDTIPGANKFGAGDGQTDKGEDGDSSSSDDDISDDEYFESLNRYMTGRYGENWEYNPPRVGNKGLPTERNGEYKVYAKLRNQYIYKRRK